MESKQPPTPKPIQRNNIGDFKFSKKNNKKKDEKTPKNEDYLSQEILRKNASDKIDS